MNAATFSWLHNCQHYPTVLTATSSVVIQAAILMCNHAELQRPLLKSILQIKPKSSEHMAKRPDRQLLGNLLRHVDTHNRMVEERIAWGEHDRQQRAPQPSAIPLSLPADAEARRRESTN
jgi:hypothetical protein